jgi:hypothetical protein
VVVWVSVALSSLLVTLVGPAAAAGSDEDELVSAYLPLLRVVDQPVPCGPGEPYRVMRPDAVLGVDGIGRNGVVLTGGDQDVAAPTEADLPDPGDDSWHLDYPGNALRPKCDYEELFDAWRTVPTVFARVTTEDGRPGELVVQYWFFYLYNDWNDRHEGDWEMIQVHFEADDAAEALAVGPYRVAFAQHEGAELSDWNGDVLEVVDGTRPVVYVAAGSHASYFRAARWFGKSAASGFGCDDTRGPHEDVSAEVEVLDDAALPRWARFEGRWGERQPSFNNGPTGPISKRQWAEPVSWADEEGRRGAVDLPSGGTAVTDAFCSATRRASIVMFGLFDRPVAMGLLIAALLVALVMALRATVWKPVITAPLVVRRSLGQMVSTALTFIRRAPRQVMRVGVLLPIAGALGAILQALVLGGTDVGDLADVADRSSGSGGALALAIGGVFVLPATAAVAVTSMLMVEAMIDRGAPPAYRELVGMAWSRRRVIGFSWGLTVAVLLAMTTVVLFPVVIWCVARWAVAIPAALHGAHPLRRSVELTAGMRWRSLGVAGVSVFFASVLPPTVGIVVLLLTDWSFAVVNLVASVVGTLFAPIAGIMQLLQWADLEARAGEGPGASDEVEAAVGSAG